MPILDTLTLSEASRQKGVNREHGFRMKLVDAIDLQIAAVAAERKGEPFKRTVLRWTTNSETGARDQAAVAVRFRPWWWKDANGALFLEVRYANKPVEIRQGKATIAVGAMDKLVPILEQIKKAVQLGELDKPLISIIAARRKELKRPTVNGNGNGNGQKAAK